MAALTDQAIVLRTWDYSETSQTVSLLTRGHGIIRALAKGSRRPRSAFDGGLEMLTRGHMAAIIKPTSELATLTEWGLGEIFPSLRASLGAHRAGIYMADLTHHMFQPNDAHPRLFDALLETLRAFEREADTTGAVLKFLWDALGEAGYAPTTDRDARTDDPLVDAGAYGFSAQAGGIVRDPGSGQSPDAVWRLRADTKGALDALARGELIRDGGVRVRAARLLGVYASWIIGRSLASGASWEAVAVDAPDLGGP